MVYVPMSNTRGPHGPSQDSFSLQPAAHLGGKTVGNRNPMPIRAIPTAPKLLNRAIAPHPLRKVLGKETYGTRAISHPQPVPSTDGMAPKSGIARHQTKGLAYMAMNRPIDQPIMPTTDSDFVFLNSKLGQPN